MFRRKSHVICFGDVPSREELDYSIFLVYGRVSWDVYRLLEATESGFPKSINTSLYLIEKCASETSIMKRRKRRQTTGFGRWYILKRPA